MSNFNKYKSKYTRSWKKSRRKMTGFSDLPPHRCQRNWCGGLLSKPKNLAFSPCFGKKNRFRKSSLILTVLSLLAVFGFAGVIATAGLFIWIGKGLPNVSSLSFRLVPQSTKIYDRTGETVLYDIHGEEKRTMIRLSEAPEFLKQATLLAEDREFYKHGGINWKGILRAAIIDVLSGEKAQGGSSITQQLVKNAILSSEKTFTRKIKELILSYRLESQFSKDEILEMYFNEIPYGSTLYGIEAAGQSFFGKKTKNLSLAEAALLVSLPKAPSYYSPYGNHREELVARSHFILDEMVKSGFISPNQAKEAKDYDILKNVLPYREKIIAPHFVMYIKDLLAEKYGEKMVEQGGLKVVTTLDLDKQKLAEEAIAQYVERNEKEFGATNAALVSLDPKTGQIFAMVGSKNFFEPNFGSVNVTLRTRQPGSSFKPIVYAAAFLKGFTPQTALYDVNTVFKTLIEGEYSPKNYDEKEHGALTMKQALAGSLNVPSVKTLYLTGINNVLDLADKMGYTTLKDRSRFGLSLVLGGGEVKLLEHTNAFGVFLADGNFNPTTPLLKVEDDKGNVLEEFQPNRIKVLDEEIYRNIIDILSDNSARSFIFGINNYLVLKDRPAAVKTGTTNDFRDAWTIGGTPSLTAGVWAGDNLNKEMKKGADGSKIAAPIWNYYMSKALEGQPAEEFVKPLPIITGKSVLDGRAVFQKEVRIDKASGKLATEYTPKSFIETRFYSEVHDILYYVNKDDPRGPAPQNPSEDEQFENWEKGVADWAERNNIIPSSPPIEYDHLHTPSNFPMLEILNIYSGMTINDRNLDIRVQASAPRGVKRIEVSLDDELLLNSPYSSIVNFSIPQQFPNGKHILKIAVFDDIDNSATKELEIKLSF